jgi:putative copper resistance protein D
LLYSLDRCEMARAPLRPVLLIAGVLVPISAACALIAQTGVMAGDPRAGFDPATLKDVLSGEAFGAAIIGRTGAGLLALLALLVLPPGRRLWFVTAGLGAVALAALAWGGHGAADAGAPGLIHTIADVVHLLAAGLWPGALVALLVLLLRRPIEGSSSQSLCRALKGFSGVGSAVVAAILASGLVNSWFLVGPSHLADAWRTPWGDVLLVKLALFAAMLAFAGLNRFRLTPSLARSLSGDPAPSLRALRTSIALESLLGLAVLAAAATLGVLPPPASA